MRIYADEILRPPSLGLRCRRIEVISAVELGHRGKSDEFHLKKARNYPGLAHEDIIACLKYAGESPFCQIRQ